MTTTNRTPAGRTRRGAAEGEIFAAVERLLAQGESYTALGMQRIADEAGVARSTMYAHFADKADLLMRLTEDGTSQLFEIAEEWVLTGREDDGLAALEATQAAVIAQQRAHAPLFSALAEVAGYDESVAEFWRGRVDRFARKLQAAIEEDQQRGLAPADLDAPVAARFVSWATERTVFAHIADPAGVSDERLARGMARAIWAVTRSA